MNANDIINEVRKRAVTASQQRILGQEISLKEYYPQNEVDLINGIYEVVEMNEYKGDNGFFSLTVFDIPQGVCRQILKMDWKMPIETVVGGVEAEDETICATGNNEMMFAFQNSLNKQEPPIDYCKDVECPTGTRCSKGICLCPNNWTQCSGICCSDGEICSTSGEASGSQCLPAKTNENDCTRNEDCRSGTYCSYSVATGCTTPNTGTCQKLESLPDSKEVIGLGKTWLGPVNLTWWSAKNWCLAHGKRLLNIRGNTLQCYDENLGNGPSNRWNYGFCNKDVTGIQNANPNAERSIVIQSLVNAYGDVKLWTDTDASNCLAWTVILGDSGYFATDNRIYKPATVLCVE